MIFSKKIIATLSLLVGLTASTYAADWYWSTDLSLSDAETVYRSYLMNNVSTNAAVAATPEIVKFVDGKTHVLGLDGVTPAQLDTLAASMSAQDIDDADTVLDFLFTESSWSEIELKLHINQWLLSNKLLVLEGSETNTWSEYVVEISSL